MPITLKQLRNINNKQALLEYDNEASIFSAPWSTQNSLATQARLINMLRKYTWSPPHGVP